MSAAATMSQPPVVPPRPSRSADKSDSSTDSQPKVPHPLKRFDRSISPNPDRFAPSPLNESLFPQKSPRATRFGAGSDYHVDHLSDDPIQRPGSVTMPSVGEEGNEYDAVKDELVLPSTTSPDSPPSSPEQTRTIAVDLHLHAPKPSVPAQTSKQRVMAVTRTDSDKAATFGIGRPSSEEMLERGGIHKKKSSVSQVSETESILDDEEHGIPEIGQRVPMNPDLGDVQAPSALPATRPESASGTRSQTPRHHSRKHSSRGFVDVPPGSYGLHGHGTPQPADKFEKAWYEKHPGDWKRDSTVSLHDRQNDFAMSSADLNKLVRDTRDSGLGTSTCYTGTPSEEVGFQASEEYTQRFSSRPGSMQSRSPELRRVDSPRKDSPISTSGSPAIRDDDEDGDIIHVDASHNRSRSFLANHSEEDISEGDEHHQFPILASDEVAKDPDHWEMQPAVDPAKERRDSFHDDDASSSRPASRPTSLYNNTPNLELNATPLEDVQEYEPLFPEEEEKRRKQEEEDAANGWEPRHKFPSKDIWEDAPDSVNATAVVSMPELPDEQADEDDVNRPETPAHAFARQQEALAEKESRESENFIRKNKKPVHFPLEQLKKKEGRPKVPNRFPSRDVWEDTPESLMHQTTVATPEAVDSAQAPAQRQVPDRLQKKGSGEKPALPNRPKPNQNPSVDVVKAKPAISEKPKPQVPTHPTKTLPSGTDSKEQDAAPRPKPAVPARPVGSKIQALQAGFMSDLNKRLQLGPRASTKKEEEEPAADAMEEKKETKPLADARKGRARGPQRRAPPTRSPAPAPAAEPKTGAPVLSFSPLRTCWSIGDNGVLEVDNGDKSEPEAKAESKEDPATETNPPAEVETKDAAEPQENVRFKSEERTPEVADEPETATSEPEPEPEPALATSSSEDVASEEPKEEVKTLASNMAGESVVKAKLEEKKDKVEPVAVESTGGDRE